MFVLPMKNRGLLAAPAVALCLTASAAPPTIVSLSPAVAAQDVKTTAITVTFDQDMGKGMSWTGGGPMFPKSAPDSKPHWVDDRTCVFPVALEDGKLYLLGINSPSFQNFRSVAGESVGPTLLYFTTPGATKEDIAKMQPPKVVKFDPANGAADINADTVRELKVTFDQPMAGGMSWTGSGPEFPKISAQGSWSSDKKSCTLPVALEKGHAYRLGINSPSYRNFTNELGLSAAPLEYRFTTAK